MPSCCTEPRAAEAQKKRPRWELADIFREYGPAYRREHPLPLSHFKVMRAIELCRTASMGGHEEKCDVCGHERYAYNSCGNRHCAKCQALTQARWLEARKAELLPVPYFHNVFTLPHELNPITLCNKKILFNLLFRSVSETLEKFAAGKGGRIGFLSTLHTWDQTLLDHFHLHCVIPGGMLSLDGNRWIPFHPNYLFPVRALSKMFQGKFIDYLQQAFQDGKLIFPGKTAAFGTKDGFRRLMNRLWEKDWVVYSKKPFAGPEQVLDYLGRYIHRVAIANHRIVDVQDGRVSFQYRDRKDGSQLKIMSLEAQEFIRRFLLHVLPDGFMRIRHFGLLANRYKKNNLSRCRQLLNFSPDPHEGSQKTTRDLMLELTGMDLKCCPRCGKGTMRVIAKWDRFPYILNKGYQPQPQILDSS